MAGVVRGGLAGGLESGLEVRVERDLAVRSEGGARVAVVDGHLATVSVGFRRRVSPDEAASALREFRGSPCVAGLPSSPNPPVEVDTRTDRPQPRLDLDRGRGMAVTVGRIRPCPILDLRMVVLGHNTVRGAAGQGVQIAELLVADGRLGRRG